MNKARSFLAAAIVLILLGVFGCANEPDGGIIKGKDGDLDTALTIDEIYTVKIETIDAETGDTVDASNNKGVNGTTVTINYKVADTALQNFLEFEGVSHAIDAVDSAEDGTRTYTINAADAKNGVITIKSTFIHTNLSPGNIAFNDTNITKTYGDAAFTNAVQAGSRGGSSITYSSSNPTIAAVDSSTGEVTIRKAGSAVITARKAADDTYAIARNKYTLTVAPKPVTITGVNVATKVYDGTTAATVQTTGVINGKINNDDVTVAAGTASFADKNCAINHTYGWVDPQTVTFSGWELTGKDAGNYILSAQPANVTAYIYQKGLTINGLTVSDKVYDGTTDAIVDRTNAVLDGIIDGDVVDLTISPTYGKASFSDALPGKDKTVTFSQWYFVNGTSVTNAKGNYSLLTPASVKANIFGLSLPQTSNIFEGTTKTILTGLNHTVNTVKWSSSDTSVVTVNNGKITAVASSGSAVITAVTKDGVYTATCTVKVIPKINTALISAGTFIMGCPESNPYKNTTNTPQHPVTLSKSFYMGKYEVTQAQWDAVMGDNYPSLNKTTTQLGKGDNYPIYSVSWYAVIIFCNKLSVQEGLEPVYNLFGETDPAEWGTIPTGSDATWNWIKMDMSKNGYRLPTDAEWEYACGGDYPNKATEYKVNPFGIGDGTKMIGDMANFNPQYNWEDNKMVSVPTDERVPYLNKTTEVGSYEPNNYGLYDMHGNVREWCWDGYVSFSKDGAAETDPTGGTVNANGNISRVERGGAYNTTVNGMFTYARGYSTSPGEVQTYRGFRVVRTAPANAN